MDFIEKHPILISIISIFILFGIPCSLFPDADRLTIWLIVFAEVGIIMLVIYIICKFNEPSKQQISDEKDSYDKIFQNFNIPNDYNKVVIHHAIQYNLYYAPAIVWRESNIVKFLIISQRQYIIEVPISKFRSIYCSRMTEFSASYNKENYWYTLPTYVRNQFAPFVSFYNPYQGKNRGVSYGTYTFGTFDFCTNSLRSILEVVNKPSSEYDIDIMNRDFILSLMPIKIQKNTKEQKINNIINCNKTYAEKQEQLYQMMNEGELTNNEVILLLKNIE